MWLGFIQALASAPRGLIDPVIRGTTEQAFIEDEVHSMIAWPVALLSTNHV